jgi:hypothetical protein
MSSLETINVGRQVNPLNGTRLFDKPRSFSCHKKPVEDVPIKQKTAWQLKRSQRKADPDDHIGL